MPGGRPKHRKNGHKATRHQTAQQKKLQAERSAATKAKTRERKEAAKKADEEKKSAHVQARWNGFFGGGATQPRVAAAAAAADGTNVAAAPNINNNTTTPVAVTASPSVHNNDVDCAEQSNLFSNETNEANNSEEHDVVVIINPAINGVIDPADAIADLDYNEEEAKEKDSDDFEDDNLPGIQQQYVAAVQKQVQSEVRKNYEKMPWLLPHLKANGWWIRKENYMWFIKQYNKTGENDEDKLVAENRAYYRDVYVWLPDVRWKTVDNRYMPYCPNCKSNKRVGPHCFRDNHAGRVPHIDPCNNTNKYGGETEHHLNITTTSPMR